MLHRMFLWFRIHILHHDPYAVRQINNVSFPKKEGFDHGS